MEIKPIKSENDYQEALIRLDEIFDAKMGTKESDEADILGVMDIFNGFLETYASNGHF